jgi:hypothetical protein
MISNMMGDLKEAIGYQAILASKDWFGDKRIESE